MGVDDDVPRLAHVLVEGLPGGVDHHGGVAGIDRGASQFHALAVIEVQRDRRLRPAREQADDRHHVLQAGVLDRAFGRLHEQGRRQLLASVDDCARRFQVEDVESTHGPALSAARMRYSFGFTIIAVPLARLV